MFHQVIVTGNFFQQLSNGPQYEKQQKHFICCIISVIRNMIDKKTTHKSTQKGTLNKNQRALEGWWWKLSREKVFLKSLPKFWTATTSFGH